MNEIETKSARRRRLFPNDEPILSIRRNKDLLFISGIVGRDSNGDPESDFERQVNLAYDDLKAKLAMENCTLEDLVDITNLVTLDKCQSGALWRAHDTLFGRGLIPNFTIIDTSYLSGYDLEIKAIARIPK